MFKIKLFSAFIITTLLTADIPPGYYDDAEGLDGEGTSFKSKNPIANSILTNCLNKKHIKVIETWQGHLDNFSGFHQSIYDLISIKK